MKSHKTKPSASKTAVGNETKPHLIPGYHAVREAIESSVVRLKALWIAERKPTPRLKEILAAADARRIPVHTVSQSELKRLFPELAHQGIVAVAESFTYADLDHLIKSSKDAEGYALLVAADHITDEGNLGALVRTAAFFGSQGLIIPKDRSAGMTPGVLKRSSGAYVHLPVSRVVNLGRALERLDKNGFWIIGASGGADHAVYDFDWRRDAVLVVGNEQKGLSRTVSKCCHQLVGIPGSGRVESLNVSVAAGVVLSELVRQQHKKHIE